METQNLVISFDYSWFLAKNLAYDECWIMKFHYRNSSNVERFRNHFIFLPAYSLTTVNVSALTIVNLILSPFKVFTLYDNFWSILKLLEMNMYLQWKSSFVRVSLLIDSLLLILSYLFSLWVLIVDSSHLVDTTVKTQTEKNK